LVNEYEVEFFVMLMQNVFNVVPNSRQILV